MVYQDNNHDGVTHVKLNAASTKLEKETSLENEMDID